MKIQFNAPDELAAQTASRENSRESANQVARRDLERYYTLLPYALSDVELTENEAKLIADALNGCWMADVRTPSEARSHLMLEVEDHMRLNGAAKKWGVDSDKLRSHLAGLDDVQALAVLDAVERFWAGDSLTVQDVGLVRA